MGLICTDTVFQSYYVILDWYSVGLICTDTVSQFCSVTLSLDWYTVDMIYTDTDCVPVLCNPKPGLVPSGHDMHRQ